VLEVEHVVRIRLEEEIGIVERHLIEALARFGPMKVCDISALLGIEEFATETVIYDLARYPETVVESNEGYAVPQGALNRLSGDKWSREVERAEVFLVNGLNGGLLPIDLGKAKEWHWLKVNLGEGDAVACDYTGKDLRTVCWTASIGADGLESLESLLKGGSSEDRITHGVPEGTIEVMRGKSKVLRERWLLAMLEVDEDGQVEARPTCFPTKCLLRVGPAKRQDFEEFLRRGSGRAYGILNPDADKKIDGDLGKDWRKHIEYEAAEGTFVVSLKSPKTVPIWAEVSSNSDSDYVDTEDNQEGAGTKQGDNLIPESLRNLLLFPLWWHPFSFAVRRIVPRDRETAQVILLLRGMRELVRLAGQEGNETVDLGIWWGDFQTRTTRDWPDNVVDHRIPLNDMVMEARRSPDANVMELVIDAL
jgi:hypothetical protein